MRVKKIKILYIGDVCGKVGRGVIKQFLPKIKAGIKPDLIIANADNVAHGKGATADTIKELMQAGVDYFTSGDHVFDRTANIREVYEEKLPVIRPLNYSPRAPGNGYKIIELKGMKILLVNLIGRVFLRMDYDCPFDAINKLLKKFEKMNFSAIIIDIHAEATSEKLALRHFLEGRATALIGTHTHVMTADSEVRGGLAYITDVGMTGFSDGILGIEKEGVIETFLSQLKSSHIVPESGPGQLSAVIIEVDPTNRQALSITPLIKKCNIN